MMATYNQYKYLYPPRPLNKISSDLLDRYDDGQYIGQVKYNGSCTVVFMDETVLKVMNRHNQEISTPYFDEIDYRSMYKGGSGFLILCGELLTKNQLGEGGKPFNHKFIIWDILCLSGEYLIGTTVEERLVLLTQLYPMHKMQVGATTGSIKDAEYIEMYEHIGCTDIKGVYKAPTYMGQFASLYQQVVTVPLYEGLVLKRKEGKLAYGFSERNNHEYILKCRKETKNYKF